MSGFRGFARGIGSAGGDITGQMVDDKLKAIQQRRLSEIDHEFWEKRHNITRSETLADREEANTRADKLHARERGEKRSDLVEEREYDRGILLEGRKYASSLRDEQRQQTLADDWTQMADGRYVNGLGEIRSYEELSQFELDDAEVFDSTDKGRLAKGLYTSEKKDVVGPLKGTTKENPYAKASAEEKAKALASRIQSINERIDNMSPNDEGYKSLVTKRDMLQAEQDSAIPGSAVPWSDNNDPGLDVDADADGGKKEVPEEKKLSLLDQAKASMEKEAKEIQAKLQATHEANKIAEENAERDAKIKAVLEKETGPAMQRALSGGSQSNRREALDYADNMEGLLLDLPEDHPDAAALMSLYKRFLRAAKGI